MVYCRYTPLLFRSTLGQILLTAFTLPFQHYAPGSEILEYLRKCAEIFKARQFIKFNHRVTSAIWDDATGKWNFKLDNQGQTVEDSADVFINGWVCPSKALHADANSHSIVAEAAS